MGHHFDSPEARADSRINISDNFLFHSPARSDHVVAIMCVSPLAGLPSPYHGRPQWRTFRPTSAYEMRFDTDGDLAADVVLRVVFEGDEAPQRFDVFLLEGAEARDESARGRKIGGGIVGTTAELDTGRIWIGEAGDPFWLDAVAAKTFLDAAIAGETRSVESFSSGTVTTGATNVLAIVVEIPLRVLGNGAPFSFYTAVGADDHGHYHQVARCGRPNFAATFVDHPERSRRMNETTPARDREEFGPDVVRVVEATSRVVGRVADPRGYAERVVRWILPDVLPFDPSLPAGFDFAGINGRRLEDDFGAVVYSVVFGRPIATSIAPLSDRRPEWPFLPPPRPLPAGVAVPERNEG